MSERREEWEQFVFLNDFAAESAKPGSSTWEKSHFPPRIVRNGAEYPKFVAPQGMVEKYL